jgi:putative Ca2+/H+ antiporter (TMEM165/GDT1 family)
MNDTLPVWLAAIVAMMFLLTGIFFGGYLATEDMMLKAVKAGHAEYFLDSNNQKQWRWKEIK